MRKENGNMSKFNWSVAKKQDIDYDLSTDLERAGGTIVRLNNSEWRTIAA